MASLVPRRPRPPLTAREIGAYLSGARAAKALQGQTLTVTELETMALDYAEQDLPIAGAMDLDVYLHWFYAGFYSRQALDQS